MSETSPLANKTGSNDHKYYNAEDRVVEWTNVSYRVHINGKDDLHVLKDFSGIMSPGRLLAIIGPSGSGKTSLLNILSGRIHKGVEGKISVNGTLINPANYKSEVAYVLQNDVHTPLQTVIEALQFSAELRLPEQEGSVIRKELVDNLLKGFMLTKCADTFIGGGQIRGISGGERKRLSMAKELITSPKIIFLDEPTSGLDMYSASTTIKLLKRLATTKRMTVVCSIHQPSSEMFATFDDCLLLNDGHCVYSGPANGLSPHFELQERPCPQHYNPADHALFLVQTLQQKELKELYRTWSFYDIKMKARIEMSRSNCVGEINFKQRKRKSFVRQMRNVLARDWRDRHRNYAVLVIRFGMACVINFLVGVVFWHVADGNDITSYFGAIVQISISAMFSNAQPVLLGFALERDVFVRDYQTGSYSAMVWILSKSLTELPIMILLNLWTALIYFFFMRIKANLLLFGLVTTLLGFCASSCAMFLGTIGKNPRRALELAPLMFVPQILFAGLFIPITSIPPILKWVQYVCFLKYGINMLVVLELHGDGRKDEIYNRLEIVESDWWFYLLVLVFTAIVFRVLAMVFATLAAQNAYDNS